MSDIKEKKPEDIVANMEDSRAVSEDNSHKKKPYCIYNNVNISTKALSITILIGVLTIVGAIIIGVLTK